MTSRRQSHIVTAIAALSLLLQAAPTQSQAIAAESGTVSEGTQTDHISITTLGKGAPVLFIPGLASPRAVFSSSASALAVSNRLYLVQVNGFGGDAAAANIGLGMLDGIVADLHSYLSKNHLTGVSVVGHSMGGLIGLMLAKQHPEDVSKLMIVDALPYVGDIFLPGAQVTQVEPQAKIMRDRTVAAYGHPVDPAVIQRTAASQALHDDSRVRIADWVAKADPRVTGEALYEDMTTDLRPELASIRTPITLVYPFGGAMTQDKADAFYKAEYAKAPHVFFVPIPDSGHFVMLDQPQAFLKALTQFLQPS